MPEIIACDEHHQVYKTWRARGQTQLKVTHVDFHCDMRGLLIDRVRGMASLTRSSDPRDKELDCGNYLTHAIMDGTVVSLRWVHDTYGGRRYDSGTVNYESDLSVRASRLLRRSSITKEVPLDFAEYTFDQWDGAIEGYQLDIDWDAFASVHYTMAQINRLAGDFLAREFRGCPETIFIVYSPGFSHPDRGLYESFIEKVSTKFSAPVTRIPPPTTKPAFAAPSFFERVENRTETELHRRGIF